MGAALNPYLSDHLAGSAAAIKLLRRLARRFSIPELRDLLVDIQADQRTLETLMRQLGVPARRAKHRLAEAGETVLEWRNRLTSRPHVPFELFEGLELLAIGIAGKQCLWRALQVIAADYPPMRRLDLAGLEQRAGDQAMRVETQRILAARAALGGR